jgi:hypothetical protein
MGDLALIKSKNKPELVTVKDRSVSAHGFRHVLMYDHLVEHLGSVRKPWCTIGCMARTMFGRNTDSNRKAMRQRLSAAFRWHLDRDVFLVIEYDQGAHGRANAVKIYSSAQIEFQFAQDQLEKMLRRREISNARYSKAKQILGATQS